jgi:hypothetical protein
LMVLQEGAEQRDQQMAAYRCALQPSPSRVACWHCVWLLSSMVKASMCQQQCLYTTAALPCLFWVAGMPCWSWLMSWSRRSARSRHAWQSSPVGKPRSCGARLRHERLSRHAGVHRRVPDPDTPSGGVFSTCTGSGLLQGMAGHV